MTRNVDQNKAEILNVEEGLKNEITQTASELEIKIQSLQSQIDGEITVINGHGVPTLRNYPAYNWTASPKTGDILVEGLRFTYSDEVYRKHQRTLFFDEDSITTYRFIKKDNVWTWEPIADTEYSVIQRQIADLNVTAQGITQSVEQLSTKVTNEYITQIEAKTLVSQTADGIKEDISQVYSTIDSVNTLKNTVEQTAAGLTAQISEVNEALDGANEVYVTQGTPTLYNYPAYNWTARPKIGDRLVEGLRFTYTDESYRKHNRALVYDEIAGKTYRFVKNGAAWGFTDVGDTEFSWVNRKLAEYKVTVDGVSADLSKFETKVGADYITKVDAQASINYSVNELSVEMSKTYATKGVVDKLATSVSTTAEGLTVKISNNEVIAAINASAEKIQISASKLDLQGLVTISALEGSGTTIINADNITTGTIKALRLEGCEIDGGAIAIGNNNIVMNEDGMWVIGTGDAEHPMFKVENNGYFTAQSGRIGNWSIGSGAIANNGTVLGSDGNLTLAGNDNAIILGSNARMTPTALHVSQGEYKGSAPWWGVYKAAMQVVASDERIKQDIEVISDDAYDQLFDSLQTYTYRFKNDSGFRSGKVHMGFISQRIKENLDTIGLAELAVYDDDNPNLLGVDKQELIALCVWQIQKLKARVTELETNIGGAT